MVVAVDQSTIAWSLYAAVDYCMESVWWCVTAWRRKEEVFMFLHCCHVVLLSCLTSEPDGIRFLRVRVHMLITEHGL